MHTNVKVLYPGHEIVTIKKVVTYSLSSFGRWLNDSGSKDSMLLKCRYLKSTVCVCTVE